jgi:hypothetical protein
MNDGTVVVTAKNGAVVIPSRNNPIYGYIRVQQTRAVISEEGWVEQRTLSALINGTVDDLRGLNYTENQVLKGKIRIVEKMKPFNTKNPEKDIKVAGDSGVICSIDGKPIYRNAFYSTNERLEDVLIQHDNTAEIKFKIAELKEAEANLSD